MLPLDSAEDILVLYNHSISPITMAPHSPSFSPLKSLLIHHSFSESGPVSRGIACFCSTIIPAVASGFPRFYRFSGLCSKRPFLCHTSYAILIMPFTFFMPYAYSDSIFFCALYELDMPSMLI